ncbi:MAG: hypothetical protein GY768_13435 [Planctomycetaceae bacterium]|nr:hypothetical protein [Planctomycetaceae bacterium]
MNVRFNQDFRIPAGPDFNVVLSVPVVTIPAKSQNYMGLGAMERVLSGFSSSRSGWPPPPTLLGLSEGQGCLPHDSLTLLPASWVL